MAFGADPHSVLGLPPGASQAEIKRAYRRLAKAFHPDRAGQAAIPRFLAIQAAYDQLMRDARTGGSSGPSGRRGAAGGAAGGATGGATKAAGGGAGARRPGWWADPGRERATRGRAAPDGNSAGPAGPAGPRRGGTRSAGAGTAGTRPPRGNRQPGRATPGSTTYDEADVDPFDPEWSGGSWYGTTSGTYWTINPREYADPRKHGPEYQARARRRNEPNDREWAEDARTNDATGPIGTGARTTGRAAPRPGAALPPQPPPPPDTAFATPETAGPLDPLAALPLPGGAGRRVAVALLGWPPLGVAIAWLLGEVSGCGRFSAGCVETFGVGSWLAQFAVLGALLLVPALAAASAVGTVALLAAALPATILLSALGGAREPDAAGGALAIALAIAWLAGAAFAIGRRSRTIPP